MLLDKMIYFDGVFIFLTFLCVMSYVKDKKKLHLRNHLIGTSFLYVIYLILDIDILPELLSIEYGVEIFIFRALIIIPIILFCVPLFRELFFMEDTV